MSDCGKNQYPKPGAIGGRIIREVIATLREASAENLALPITSHILIAVSGGSDSMALARVLIRYGRRVGDPRKIRLVHINHGWRGKESDGDEAFVRAAAKRWGVPVSVFRIRKPALGTGRSPEEAARQQRKQFFSKLGQKYSTPKHPAWIFTAHHADDLAETVLWRLFTGTLDSHGGGISILHERELRPFLRLRKGELVAFLREEGEGWRDDRTNFEGTLLRSKMRLHLLPVIEMLFPRAVENLTQLALEAQKKPLKKTQVDPGILFSASGLAVRRAHWEWLRKPRSKSGRLMLPGGWVLSNLSAGGRERWVLER